MSDKQTAGEQVFRDIHALPGAALRFRDELRAARYAAGRDSEGFQEIVFAIERVGRACCPTAKDLGRCKPALKRLIGDARDKAEKAANLPTALSTFDALFELVREGRNDALHQGAVARNLTKHSIELALILEDALMLTPRVVRDFMVTSPVCAEVWESISSIRRTMLVNAYSFLPFKRGDQWFLLSDYNLARFVSEGGRMKRLASLLSVALEEGSIAPTSASRCYADETVEAVLTRAAGLPLLVFDKSREQLIGLLTTYDVL